MENKQIVCLNGHQKHSSVAWNENVSGFCDKCGQKLISQCPECGSPIKGKSTYPEVIDLTSFPVPKYCCACGKPFPWTSTAIEAAKELIDSSDLDEAEKDSAKDSIVDIVSDNPRTSVASSKFKSFISKAGPVIGNGLRDILVDVLSETAKKTIWGT